MTEQTLNGDVLEPNSKRKRSEAAGGTNRSDESILGEDENPEIMCNNSSLNTTQTPEMDITDHMEFWIYCVCIPIVAVPGILASIISIFIFTRKSMRSSLNVYLAGLSFYDFLVLAMALCLYPPMVQCIKSGHQGYWCTFFWNAAIVAFPLSLIAQFGSVWTCVLLTIDRYLAVKYPLHSRSWCTTRRAFFGLLLVTVCGIFYRIPSMFELTHDEKGVLIPTQLRHNLLYQQIYHIWTYLILMFLIPWAVMLILNMIVAIAVRKAYIARKALAAKRTTKEDREHRCTVIAIAIIVTFVIFNCTAFVNHCLEVIFGRGTPGTTYFITRRLLIFIGNLLICLNSATNFLIYCLGHRFRQLCVRLLCPCLKHISMAQPTFLPMRGSNLNTSTPPPPMRRNGGSTVDQTLIKEKVERIFSLPTSMQPQLCNCGQSSNNLEVPIEPSLMRVRRLSKSENSGFSQYDIISRKSSSSYDSQIENAV